MISKPAPTPNRRNSDLTNFNSFQMGPKTDLVGELKREITARDMKSLLRFIRAIGITWRSTKTLRPERLNPKYADLYGPVHDTDVQDVVPWKNRIEKQSRYISHLFNAALAHNKEVEFV